jgi:hypothetical protein
MKIWKSLNDLEKKDVILQSDKILLELKKTVLESGLFRDNTHPAIPQEGNPEFRYNFIGQNVEIYWFNRITSLVFLLTRVKKITKKSFWGEKIEEEKEIIPLSFKKDAWIQWDFDDFNEQSNYNSLKLNESEKTFLNKFFELLNTEILKANDNAKLNIKNLNTKKEDVLIGLDKNNDGEVDLIENDFNKLFSKNQKRVMDIDKNYIHQFVKVSNFIKTKKQNTQKIFESIRDTSSQEELEERVALLKNQIYSYELLVFHSINMIGALVSEDLITFYEIYESFDKLGMFNSNWENEVSEKLTNIGDKLDDLMYSIYNMEQNIVNELSHLSYITQESFEDLNRSVTNQLREVESSINTNNLLTGIQTYQLYKINKNTKSLRN